MSDIIWMIVVGGLLLLGGIACYYRLHVVMLRDKLQVALHNNAETASFMTLFSRNIRNSSEVANWLNVTAKYVADAVEAESVAVFTSDESYLRLTGSAGPIPRSIRSIQVAIRNVQTIADVFRDTEKEDVTSANLIEEAVRNHRPILIDNPDDPRIRELEGESAIYTIMVVPMMNEGKLIGVLCAVNNKARHLSRKPFTIEQFGRLKFYVNQVVLAENILMVYSSLSEQQRINQELDFARNLQSSLLPDTNPEWGQFSICASTRASKEVSGDFFDFVEIDQNRMLVVIGDACGKGIPACMIMAMTRSFIRANVSRFTTLKNLLMELNDNLYRDMGDGRYITLGICLLDRKESTFEYARAGHTELLTWVRGHIRSFYPDGAGVGLLPGMLAEYDTLCLEFSPGMALLLFTDGINEALSPSGEYFGIERLNNIFIKSCTDNDYPEETIARIFGAVDDFSEKPHSQLDDQTVVLIRCR